MEFFETNFIWLLLLVIVIFIFGYKMITKNPEALTDQYEAKKTINGNPSDNLKRIEEALKNAGFRKVVLDQDKNRFYARAKMSMSSWSENIEVCYSHDKVLTHLKFKSICTLPTQIVAWGKNERNFKRFEKELDKLLSATDTRNKSYSKTNDNVTGIN